MKFKNVLKGLQQKYNIEEINVISTSKVIYSGTLEGWKNTEPDMLHYKKQVENLEVIDHMMFNNRKAFLFVPDVGVYYPPIN